MALKHLRVASTLLINCTFWSNYCTFCVEKTFATNFKCGEKIRNTRYRIGGLVGFEACKSREYLDGHAPTITKL